VPLHVHYNSLTKHVENVSGTPVSAVQDDSLVPLVVPGYHHRKQHPLPE